MSSVTSSTARTSPVAPPPKTDSPSGKTLVRLLISSRGMGKMVTARTSPPIFTDLHGSDQVNLAGISPPCNHWHGKQRSNHAQGLPAGEVLPEDEAGQQYG